jgi:hypothetical protein
MTGKLLVLLAAAAAAASGIAYGAISSSGDVIRACYGSATGALRIIDETKASCLPSEKALSWNQTGPQGAAGTAVAYASVGRLGAVFAESSKNVSQANVTHPAAGLYCFGGLGFTPKSIQVTPISGIDASFNPTAIDTIATAIVVFPPDTTAYGCADTDTVRVRTVAAADPATLTDRGFMIWFEE